MNRAKRIEAAATEVDLCLDPFIRARHPESDSLRTKDWEHLKNAMVALRAALRPDHAPTYQRRRGGIGRFGGVHAAYTIICSCGWTTRINGNKREAVKTFNSHKAYPNFRREVS